METALALISRPTASLGKPTRKDRDIWLMKKRGWSDDQLATSFHVSVDKIRLAIDRWDLYRASFANEEIDLSINQMATALLPKAQKVLEDGMKATKTEERWVRGKRVIVSKVVDHTTRLKSFESFKNLIEAVRPKGVGVQVNTQINNPAKDQAPAVPKGFDFESRLRMIRAEKGLSNDDTVEDADFEDGDESDVLSDELAEIGIEIPEEDEDDEDGE
jgi:hypothetical protein